VTAERTVWLVGSDPRGTAYAGYTLSESAELGLRVAERQNRAARKVDQAMRAKDAAEMWRRVEEARAPLEELETELHWAEHPRFEGWYRETWIRSRFSRNNPHRAYEDLRVFQTSDGRERPARPTP
jgi:hypothetical protein